MALLQNNKENPSAVIKVSSWYIETFVKCAPTTTASEAGAIWCAQLCDVTISQVLQWRNHIHATISKATRKLGFLSQRTPSAKARAYCTLIRPAIRYTSSLWDLHQATLTRQVKHVQRRAARFGYNNYRDTYPRIVIRLLHQLELDSLQHRRTIHVLVLCYKIRNQLVDINSENYFAPGDKRTRRSHGLGQQRASKEVYINSFFPRSARDWNRLAEQVTEAHTIEKFRTRLSSVLWSQLQPW